MVIFSDRNCWKLFIDQHFQRRRALQIALSGVLEQSMLCMSCCPLERAQKDFLRLESLLPGFGSPVTAVLSLEPGFSRRYALTAALLIPSVLSDLLTFCQSSDISPPSTSSALSSQYLGP